jgi:hypothetical protein
MISLIHLFEQEENSDGKYRVPMIEKEKNKKLNPKTNRIKIFKTSKYLFTDIKPEDRTFKNLPRYADKKPKVRFQDWLEIDTKKLNPNNSVTSWGWGADGKCYGWSHRAVAGFKIGDIVKSGNIASGGKTFTLDTKEKVEEHAKAFAKDVG